MSYLEEIKKQKDELESKLERLKEEHIAEVVERIRTMIEESGLTPFDVGRELMGTIKTTKKRKIYQDPANPDNTYGGGPLPTWFSDGMRAIGLDPTSADNRLKFKEENLTLVL